MDMLNLYVSYVSYQHVYNRYQSYVVQITGKCISAGEDRMVVVWQLGEMTVQALFVVTNEEFWMRFSGVFMATWIFLGQNMFFVLKSNQIIATV